MRVNIFIYASGFRGLFNQVPDPFAVEDSAVFRQENVRFEHVFAEQFGARFREITAQQPECGFAHRHDPGLAPLAHHAEQLQNP